MVRDTARDYAQDMFRRVLNAYRNEQYDPAIVREMGVLGLLGATIPEPYGRRPRLYRLRPDRARDRARRFRLPLGESAQSRTRFMPTAARRSGGSAQARSGEFIGCFGPTEPDYGSDPGSMTTRAEKVSRRLSLTAPRPGSRTPRSPTSLSRKLYGKIRGFIVERGTHGFSTPRIEGKLSLRASITGERIARAPSSPRRTSRRMFPGLPGRSAANLARTSPGRHGGRGVLLAPRACSRASSSAARSPPTSSSRKSSPTCRPRSRSACTRRCGSPA